MQHVAIVVKNALPTELRAECRRLGYSITDRMQPKTLRKLLNSHQSAYVLWRKYQKLAELLFGNNLGHDTLDELVNAINDRLYDRLVAAGQVCGFALPPGGLLDADSVPILVDANDHEFVVASRQTPRAVNASFFNSAEGIVGRSTSYSILIVTRIAFPDVEQAYKLWKGAG